ncbi:MAG: BACON domain-containing protein [Bacteroidetes bacterium]|uniref:BACON domain-containing protein n=1 Tax=Candidatus Merdivivens pullistercoris TaxID=2840873 RepID=A0A9D9I4B5_9BACT|nr:BACON domain-containing protein [Candidatus Merdivivens pullistercoris]
MKKILNNMAAALVLTAGVAFCTVSCQEGPITGPAEFSIVDTIVEVPAEGGEFSATYFLENPVLGEEVHPTCSDSWVSGFNTLTAYEITFTVSANMTEGVSREAVVNVEYNGENFSFTVAQECYDVICEAVTVSGSYYTYIAKNEEDPEAVADTLGNYFIEISNQVKDGERNDTDHYSIDIYAAPWTGDEANIGIPVGVYTLGNPEDEENPKAGTFTNEYSYYYGIDAAGEPTGNIAFNSGTLEVAVDEDGNYSLLLVATFEDGSVHYVTYSGPVSLYK